MRRAAFFLLFVAVGIAAAAGGAWWWTGRPLPLPASPYAFDVRPGASLGAVARDLAGAGVLPDARILVAYARLAGVDRAIKAGNYELPAGITLRELLARLTQGDVTQTALTVVEGTTFADLRRGAQGAIRACATRCSASTAPR